MTDIRNTLVALCVASAALGALAQSADEHKDHHPADAGAPAQAVKPPVQSPAQTAPAPAQNAAGMAHMDQHMKSMQVMHDKMVAAKTPEERQALMAEHMRLMQQGMAMMKDMGGMGGKGPMAGMPSGAGMGGNMADRQQTLEKRMDMMESMMQMMMDRLPAGAQAPAAPK